MKTIVYVALVLITFGLSWSFFEVNALNKEQEKYLEDTVSNIYENYQILSNKIESIHNDMEVMQEFFYQIPADIPNTYLYYYNTLNEIRLTQHELSGYVLVLDKECNKIDVSKNLQCVSYHDNIKNMNDNIDEVISKFNNAILKYNEYRLTNFAIFEG